MKDCSRRRFIRNATAALSGAVLAPGLWQQAWGAGFGKNKVRVSGHLWQYASAFRPHHDCTPILDQVFSDFKYAGIQGVELMDINLKAPEAVANLRRLIEEYDMPVTGTSYEAPMWDRQHHVRILEEVDLVTDRLRQVGGTTFGISVGYKRGKKTEAELDAQGVVLEEIRKRCRKNRVAPNLHNHTYEVADGLYDLKGTLARVPEMKLGPDLAHLYRAGVDPVWFIQTYGKQIAYLHIRDHKADKSWTESVGEGSIDFPAIAQALQKVGFKGRAAIELSFEGTPVRPLKENWRRSRSYVKEVFGW